MIILLLLLTSVLTSALILVAHFWRHHCEHLHACVYIHVHILRITLVKFSANFSNFLPYLSADRSAVKLSLQSVTNPYVYREQGISTTLGLLKAYLQDESDIQGSLAVKVTNTRLFTVVKANA